MPHQISTDLQLLLPVRHRIVRARRAIGRKRQAREWPGEQGSSLITPCCLAFLAVAAGSYGVLGISTLLASPSCSLQSRLCSFQLETRVSSEKNTRKEARPLIILELHRESVCLCPQPPAAQCGVRVNSSAPRPVNRGFAQRPARPNLNMNRAVGLGLRALHVFNLSSLSTAELIG